MAMNKAEKAAMEELRARAALTLPPYVKPQTVNVREELANEEYGVLFVGWHMNEYSKHVGQGCSSGMTHSRSRIDKTDSQHPGNFYRTKLEALQAMRWALTERVMRELAEVDKKIADETGGGV